MFYTIVPEDDLLFDEEEKASNSSMEIEVGGCLMSIEPLDVFSGRIERIISSDPQHYMNPQYQPGTVIKWF